MARDLPGSDDVICFKTRIFKGPGAWWSVHLWPHMAEAELAGGQFRNLYEFSII